MNQQELLQMSQKERDRLKVLHEANHRHITQKEAGGQMGVSERWVRKLLARMRKEGDRAALEPQDSRAAAEESGGAGAEGVWGFRPHAGQRVSGGAARGAGEPGDAARLDERGAVVEAAASTRRVSGAANSSRATGSVRQWRVMRNRNFLLCMDTNRGERRLGWICS